MDFPLRISQNPGMDENHPLRRPELRSAGFFPRPDDPFEPPAPGAEDHAVPVAPDVAVRLRLFTGNPAAPNILFFHGNGETARDYDDQAAVYRALPATLAVADYRGYGPSGGIPTWSTLLPDAEATLEVYRRLLADRGHRGRVVVMGRSLGSAPAIHLASLRDPLVDGLIVESGFAQIGPLLELFGVPARRLGVTEEMGPGNLRKMHRVRVPTLILHAEEDEIIPLRDAELLDGACPDPDREFFRVPLAGHNDIQFRAGQAYFSAIRRLLNRVAG